MAAGSIASDPRYYPNPGEFNGFRVEKLRRSNDPGAEHKHQLVTTGKESLLWGHGTLVCLGRFYASSEIKTVLVEFLRRYDIQLMPGTSGRPPNINIDIPLFVDSTVNVQIRVRRL